MAFLLTEFALLWRGMINISKVRPVSNPHYNPINSPSQDTGLVTLSKDGYERISSLTLYIPENINIDRLLLENPPDFSFERDCFVYILHLINSIPARKRDIIESNNGYTPINRALLQRRIHDYKNYIEYLKRLSIIIENRQYIPTKLSMGLRITEAYSSRIIPVIITKWSLIKNIKYLNKNYNEELTEELKYLEKWFNNKIEVDYEGGVNFLNELSQQESDVGNTQNLMLRYNCRLLPFIKLKNCEYPFYVDKTGFRLHTNLTQMLSGLRKFIKYDGKTLCAIDISNSQPYLAISLLDDEIFINNNLSDKIINPKLTNNTNYPIMLVEKIRNIKNAPDVKTFKENVSSGRFYENFGRLLVENELTENANETILRAKAKEITFTSIYSSNTSIGYNESIKLFKRQFPNVYEVFSIIKQGQNNHPAFSICLQRLEAELVLHKICKNISEESPDVVLFSLHDSIITTEDNVEYVQSVMYNVLRNNIGIAPTFKVERWE